MTKYQRKQNYLLLYHDTSNKFKEIDIINNLNVNNEFKEIHIKYRTYFILDDMTIIKNLDPNKIKIYEKSYWNTKIYYTGYMTVEILTK